MSLRLHPMYRWGGGAEVGETLLEKTGRSIAVMRGSKVDGFDLLHVMIRRLTSAGSAVRHRPTEDMARYRTLRPKIGRCIRRIFLRR